MAGLDEQQRAEELRRRLEEIRKKAFAEELARLDSVAASRVGELAGLRRRDEETRLGQLMEQAVARKASAEKQLAALEPQVLGALGAAIAIRTDARRRDEESSRKKAEEARVRQEADKKKAEEEARARAEADQRKQEIQKKKAEEEARMRAEAEQRKKREEERLRAEAERKKKEEEQRRLQEAEAKRRKEEDEKRKREEDARRKAEEERRRTEEEARRADEEARATREAAERERLRAEEEAREQERRERQRQEQLARAKEEQEIQRAATAAATPAMGELTGLDDEPADPTASAAPKSKNETKDAAKKTAAPAKTSLRLPLVALLVLAAGALIVSGVLYFTLKKTVLANVSEIAVAPWSAAGDDNAVASSLAEEVARQMEQAASPAVLGFGSVRRMARAGDPVQAAFALGYPYVLRGSLLHQGDIYTCNIQLVDSTGDVAWEKSYARGAEGLAILPAEVVAEVRGALHLTALPSGSKPATNPSAYLLYLRGLHLLHAASAQELRDAYALFDQAVALEPEFSEALAAKARTIVLAIAGGSPIDGTSLEDAKKLSADAIANNPSSASGYLARGLAFDQLKQYRMAFQQLENALQRSPNSADAQLAKAAVHLKVGQHEDGMNALTAAYRLSPRDPAILTLIAQTYQLARATKEGFAYHELALQCVPDTTAYVAGPMADAILTDASLTLAQADRVGAALQRTVSERPDDYRALYRLARLDQVSGKALEAITLLATAETKAKDAIVARPQDAEAAAMLALILTREGKFTDAVPLAQRVLQANPANARVGYIVAQMYALQMYSGKTLTVDEETRKLCVATLHDAMANEFRFDELANGDFYNMYEHGDFASVIQAPLR